MVDSLDRALELLREIDEEEGITSEWGGELYELSEQIAYDIYDAISDLTEGLESELAYPLVSTISRRVAIDENEIEFVVLESLSRQAWEFTESAWDAWQEQGDPGVEQDDSLEALQEEALDIIDVVRTVMQEVTNNRSSSLLSTLASVSHDDIVRVGVKASIEALRRFHLLSTEATLNRLKRSLYETVDIALADIISEYSDLSEDDSWSDAAFEDLKPNIESIYAKIELLLKNRVDGRFSGTTESSTVGLSETIREIAPDLLNALTQGRI
ncbi:MAG: hypothetical protein L0177_08705 [Chloroflexi bacterium]|nr:hypothetical protein [Chloroflexota bacterium]